MRRIPKLLAALTLAAGLCLAGGFSALAAPMPAGVVWDVTSTTTLQAGSIPYTGPGDVRIEAKDSGNNPITLDLNGQSFTITGNLDIFGTLFVNNGTLTVTGNVSVMNGTLKMTETNSKLIVKGNFTSNGKDHTGMLTAGTLTVYGDLIQYADFSRKAFCPAEAFKTELVNANKLVYFESPDGSWFNGVPTDSMTFKPISRISLNVNLASDKNFAYPYSYPNLFLRGALNGKTATVPGGTVIAGPLMMGGGRLYARDALTVGGDGSLGMENAADYVEVAGNFTAGGHSDYKAGKVKILGNFYQHSTVHNSSYHDDSYACLPAHQTILVGASKTVVFDTPGSSYFGQLLTDTGATFSSGSTISLNCDLAGDAGWNYPNLYYGGRLNGHELTVNGDLHARTITLGGGSKLHVTGNFTAASDNCLIMSASGDKVTVDHNFTSRYNMDPASLAAGTLEIGGEFRQEGSATAFTASGSHTTKFVGTGKYVTFANPGTSYFNKLDVAGVTFSSQSVLSVKADLTEDLTVAVPTLYYSGNLDTHKLSLTGNLHLFGSVNPGGGLIEATGNTVLEGTLTMADGDDALSVGGDFTGSGTAALSAGTADFKKSFRYSGTAYNASGTHITQLSGGANMSVVFDRPESAWFARVTINPGTTLASGSVLSIRTDGTYDFDLAAPTLYMHGNLNGHGLSLTGNLAVPAGKTLTLGGGNVLVSGNMSLNNSLLEMTDSDDRLTVGGTFTANGQNETGKLTEGVLTVKGNFTQLGGNSAWSFVGSGNHATVLSGTAPQTVSFETPGTTDGSRFGRLYLMNPSVAFSTTCYCSNGDGNHGVATAAELKTLTYTYGATRVPVDLVSGQLKYICVLPEGETGATVEAARDYEGNTTMTMNGAAVSSVVVSGVGLGVNQQVDIIVSAADNVVVNKYTVMVEQLDAYLSDIGVSTGSLSPAFDRMTTTYTVTLPASTASIELTPQAHNEDSTFTIGGNAVASRTYEPKPGETIAVPIVVTGQDGSTTKTYTVNVYREPMLSGIGATAGTFTSVFSSPQQNYLLNVPAWQDSATLSVTRLPACTGVTIDGTAADSKPFTDLPVGGEKGVDIVVSAGSATFTYHVKIKRLAILSGFGYYPSSGAVLSPAFNPEGGTFTLTIPATVSYLSITPQKVDCSSLTINGSHVDYVGATPSVGGSEVVTIVATAGTEPNLEVVTFTLTVKRSKLISNLVPSEGTLTPAFDPTVHSYTVNVPATSEDVSVTPAILTGAVTINGHSWDPANPDLVNATVDPEPGESGDLTLVATDGSTSETYTVRVNRQKPVTAIGISAGTLFPAFDARIEDYTLSLPAYTSSVVVSPTRSVGCSRLTINGTERGSITLEPAIGDSETATVRAYGADGTVTIYTVTATRAALLSNIKVSTGTLTPAFEGGVANYSVYLPNSKTSVTVTPVKSASCATLRINGKKVTSITLRPAAGGSAKATVDCTSAGYSTPQQYVITAYRIQPVTGIKLSAGKLSSAFSMTKNAYTVSVPAYVSSVTVTPTRGASCASLTMDAPLGKLSPAIGCSASTTITAVAVDGQRFTYTVTVNRKPLLKGIAVSTGSYSPAFSVTTASYSMTVPATTASVKVTPSKGSGAKTMKINGKTASYVTLKPVIGGFATASIVVSDGRISQTYTLRVNREKLLTGLSASPGTITPAFDAAVTSYTVNLPTDTTDTVLTATQAASGVQGITMNGTPQTTLTVPVESPGSTTMATVVATASDGVTKATYTVAVKRNPIIQNITVTAAGGALSPAFSPLKLNYSVSVPAATQKIRLTAVPGTNCASTDVDGTPSSKEFSLAIGESRTITVSGRSTGGLPCAYSVTLTRAKLVTSIRTNSTAYPISFNAMTSNYTVVLPPSKSSITIYATKAAGAKMMTMNGAKRTSLTVSPVIGGSKQVKIVATAPDGITKSEYTVTVIRSTLVNNITVSGATFAFNSATHSYLVTVPYAQASTNIAVTKSSIAGTVKINSIATATATLSPAPGGTAVATITVYASGSTTVKDTYTIVVKRASS